MTTEARMTLALESWLSAPDHHLLQIDDPHYPSLLREISRPPPVLFVCGNPDVLTLPQLAIVGSRNATAEGAETARSFAAHLAGTGFCITSGLAEGIDAAAHGASEYCAPASSSTAPAMRAPVEAIAAGGEADGVIGGSPS